MLTVTHGRAATRKHILAYSLLLVPVAVGIGFTSIGGPFYLSLAIVLNIWFLKGAFTTLRRSEAVAQGDSYRAEKSFFRFSILYLFLTFGALLAEASLKFYGWGGW